MEAEEMGKFSFFEDVDWEEMFCNSWHHHPNHKNAEDCDEDLGMSEWLITDENNMEEFCAMEECFNENSSKEIVGLDRHWENLDSNNSVDEGEEENPSLEIDGIVFNVKCFQDELVPEFRFSNSSLSLSDNRSVTTIISNAGDLQQPEEYLQNSIYEDTKIEEDGMVLSQTEYKGLRLVHLLTECAEAISRGAEDLAEVLLLRLRGLISPIGSTMERVAYYLFHVLDAEIDPPGHFKLGRKDLKKAHYLESLKLLLQVYPSTKLAHFTANQYILETLSSKKLANRSLHVIDFDIMEGVQWPPLMEALKSGNHPFDYLKITAVRWGNQDQNNDLLLYEDTGRRLKEYAESLGNIPLIYEEIELENVKDLRASEGEILVANCMWGLPHMTVRGKSYVQEFLKGFGAMRPGALVLATGPHGFENGPSDFVHRFSTCLRDLCALFDSLEAVLPYHGLARAMVERIFFGTATRAYFQGMEEPSMDAVNVMDLPTTFGFREGVMSKESMMQGEYVVSGCREGGRGYNLVCSCDNQLVLKWGPSPLVWISTWIK